jgi:MOSC domain-containing protein YiiM
LGCRGRSSGREWLSRRLSSRNVTGAVALRELNLAGGRQADLTVHGGPKKAVYAYPGEHYEYWRDQLPDAALLWGAFGENLTTSGLNEDTLRIGDLLRVGSAVLRVTQPRMPCYKLQLRFNRGDMIERSLASGRSGFYLSVEDQGEVGAGSTVEILDRDSNGVTVADILSLYLGRRGDPELLRPAMNVTSLPASWKTHLLRRAQDRSSKR